MEDSKAVEVQTEQATQEAEELNRRAQARKEAEYLRIQREVRELLNQVR